MNKEIKDKWLKALRSGKYKQTKGALHRPKPKHEGGYPEGYCCLGVLCEVVVPNPNWIPEGNAYMLFGDTAIPAQLIIDKLELSDEESHDFWSLPPMNDRGDSFEDIATYIEEKL